MREGESARESRHHNSSQSIISNMYTVTAHLQYMCGLMNIDAPWNYSTYLHTSVNASILHAPNSVHPEVHPLIRNLQTASTSFP